MINLHNKTVLGLAILAMLSTSPMSVSYTFAESSDGIEQKTAEFYERGTNTQAIITEKVVDGKLEVKRFALPENISKEDMNRMISFEGETGWAYVNQKAYQSGIILYDGKVFKVGKNLWELSEEKTLGLHGSTRDTSKNEEFSFRVLFSGKVIEAGSETFAVIFTNSNLKDPNTDRISLAQITESIISYSDTNSKSLRNSLVG